MSFLNVVEIESAVIALARTYPDLCRLITLPHLTVEGRQSHALKIGRSDCPRSTVLIISGTHAREWGGPDIVIDFAADLLEAYSLGTGLAYGGTSFSASQVGAIVNGIDVIAFPDINPDGRHHSQTVYPMWRKNRNPASSGGVPTRIGIDINRNYDFLWDFPTTFAPAAVSAGTLASNDPGSDLFHGTAAFSEAESRNVRWLFEQYPRIAWFVDVHSYGGDILHPWGDDANQLGTAAMNFTNPAYNGQRGIAGDAYGEYIYACDLARLRSAGNAMRDAIAGVRGQPYAVAQSFFLPGWTTYPTAGASEDWAFGRHYADPGLRKVLGYTIEFNKTWTFFPPWSEMQNIILDVDAALVRLCVNASPRFPWLLFTWCWWKDGLNAIWKRLWPKDLWGPYGPWGRMKQAVGRVIGPILGLFQRPGGDGPA